MKKDNIAFGDFMKLDLRVGLVVKAQPLEASQKLIELTVDLGEDYGTVTILAGIRQFYEPEQLQGKKFVFVANLDPKPMAGSVSNGMMLAVDHDGKPLILPMPEEIIPGTALR